MGAREVGGTVVKVALGVAAGVVVMLVRDGGRDSVETSAARARSPAADESARSAPSSAPAPRSGDVVAAVAKREAESPPADAADDELARLREQVAELQAEVKRLRALLADGNVRHHTLHQLIAANELQHGRLYEELLGLIVDDPESVTEDPRRAFELIVRLIDETGLAAAPVVDGERAVTPEPAAPELRLTLRHEVGTTGIDRGDGTAPILGPCDDVQFNAALKLPKTPEGWLGEPLSAEVSLEFRVSERFENRLQLEADVDSPPIATFVSWCLQWEGDEASVDRSPYRGSKESRVTTLADVATERAWFDHVFQQLMTRAR